MSRLGRRGTGSVAGLLLMVAACLLGPLLHDPVPADPLGAQLLRPTTSVTVLELEDGRALVSPQVDGMEAAWRITRGGATESISKERVRRVFHRRLWLGSDRYGRDILDRLLLGGRLSLAIAGSALLMSLLLGLTIGLAAATGPRWLDAVLMRLLDAWMAFPMLFLLILLVAIFRPGPVALVAILGLSSWMGLARLVRGQALSLSERPFMAASRAMGTPWYLRWALHYLPNLVGPVLQDSALRLGDLIIAEATLSFLGLGIQPPTPSWGSMVAEGQSVLLSGWWLATFPGVAIALLVILLAVTGDAVQHATGSRSAY